MHIENVVYKVNADNWIKYDLLFLLRKKYEDAHIFRIPILIRKGYHGQSSHALHFCVHDVHSWKRVESAHTVDPMESVSPKP